MGNRIYHITAIIILLFCGCSKAKKDCTEKGEFTSISRQTGVFQQITVEDRIDVELIQDVSRKGEIVLSGYGNLFSGIESIVENGHLYLRDNNRCKWLRELDNRMLCQVYIDTLASIHILDNAAVRCMDTLYLPHFFIDQRSTAVQNFMLAVGKLHLDHREAGKLEIKGTASLMVATIYETGILQARELSCDDIYVHHYGLNKVEISPIKSLDCQIENTGGVNYYSDPTNGVNISGKGSGQVKRLF